MRIFLALLCLFTATTAFAQSASRTSAVPVAGNAACYLNTSQNLTPCTSIPPSQNNATDHTSFQPGGLTAVTNTKSVFSKFSKASTVDNLEGSAQSFTCTVNPTITLYECGTSTTCASSPVTIGAVTITAAGTVVDGTVSAPAITAGDYVAWAISAGTCTVLDISAVAQVHAN